MNKYITITTYTKVELQSKVIELKHVKSKIAEYDDYSDMYKESVNNEIIDTENMISYMEYNNIDEIMTIGNQIVPIELYNTLDGLSKTAIYR